MTIKLATALILEVSEPRESIFNELENDTANTTFNVRVVFYNTLKYLDVMVEICAIMFSDHPGVSTKLVICYL